MNDEVVPEPKKSRGRPTKHGKAMSNNERQKKRQLLLNSVLNGFIEFFSKIGTADRVQVKRNNFFLDNGFCSNDYKSFINTHIPKEIIHDLHEKIQERIAINCYEHDRRLYSHKMKYNKNLNIPSDYHILSLISSYCSVRFKDEEPTKTFLEKTKFFDDFENFPEQQYIEVYKEYRNYEPYLRQKEIEEYNRKIDLEKLSQSEKAKRTRINNMRDYVFKYERERLIPKSISDSSEHTLLWEKAWSIAAKLSDEELKARYKDLELLQSKNVVHEPVNVVQSSEIVAPKTDIAQKAKNAEKTPVLDASAIQTPTDVVRPVRPPRFQRKPRVIEEAEKPKSASKPEYEYNELEEPIVVSDFSNYVNNEK